MEQQSLDDSTSVYNIVTEYFKPTHYYCSGKKKKKDSFQKITAYWQCTSSPKALMEMSNEINVVFMPANPTFILQPMDQSNFDFQVLLFKKYIL